MWYGLGKFPKRGGKEQMKETLSFNQDWRFHLGDIPVEEAKLKSPMYIEAKTARKRCGPAAREYMDGTEFYNETNLISHETWLSVNGAP